MLAIQVIQDGCPIYRYTSIQVDTNRYTIQVYTVHKTNIYTSIQVDTSSTSRYKWYMYKMYFDMDIGEQQ